MISPARRRELARALAAEWRLCFEALAALERDPGRCRLARLRLCQGRAAGLLLSGVRRTAEDEKAREFFLIRPAGEEDAWEQALRRLAGRSERWLCYILDGRPAGAGLVGLGTDFLEQALAFVRPAGKGSAETRPGQVAPVATPVPEEIFASTDLYSRGEITGFARRGELFAAWAEGRPVSWAAIVHRFASIAAVQVGMVYTVPEMRGRGLATAVLWQIAGQAGREGRDCIYDCASSNMRSRRTAVAAGYEMVGSYWVVGRLKPRRVEGEAGGGERRGRQNAFRGPGNL